MEIEENLEEDMSIESPFKTPSKIEGSQVFKESFSLLSTNNTVMKSSKVFLPKQPSKIFQLKTITHSKLQLIQELRMAVEATMTRGLYQAAKWASELLKSVGPIDFNQTSLESKTELTEEETKLLNNLQISVTGDEQDKFEHDQFMLSKIYFELKEFKRCESTLVNTTGSKSFFLRGYSKYLV